MPKRNMRKVIVVEGFGSFPIDMLRHDSCWPATSQDASLAEDKGNRRKITLLTDSPNSPTLGRWDSFSWSVVEVRNA